MPNSLAPFIASLDRLASRLRATTRETDLASRYTDPTARAARIAAILAEISAVQVELHDLAVAIAEEAA